MNKHTFEKKSFDGLSLIIPTFNEEENIRRAVEEIYTYCRKLKEQNLQFEILIVNDGSFDRTHDIIDNLCTSYPGEIIAIHNPKNEGYGCSIAKGIQKSRFDLIFFTDADRQFKIENLDLLLPLMFTGVPDIVMGYRLNRKDSLLRRFLSWGFNTLVGFLLNLQIKDIDCAFKLFKREVFSKIKIKSRRFFANTEILAKARYLGFNILEVGVAHFPRTAGRSSVSIKYIPITIRELLRIRRELKLMI